MEIQYFLNPAYMAVPLLIHAGNVFIVLQCAQADKCPAFTTVKKSLETWYWKGGPF